jgi:hypothetical protein
MKKNTVVLLLLCLYTGFASAQEAGKKPIADKITEHGIEYYRVRTLEQLRQIGFDATPQGNGTILAAARGHRGGRDRCCSFNSGRCSSLIKVDAGGAILSAKFVEEETPAGKVIRTTDNLIPYYNGKVNKNVLFR